MMAIGGSCAITAPGRRGEESAENEILKSSRVSGACSGRRASGSSLEKPEAPNIKSGISRRFSLAGE